MRSKYMYDMCTTMYCIDKMYAYWTHVQTHYTCTAGLPMQLIFDAPL
jgi:hypothetical protein